MDEQKTKRINEFLEKTSQKINPLLLELLLSNVSPTFQPLIKYQITTGGKRVRPALALACCLMLGGRESDILKPSCGLELLHNYTLIIDDIIDNGLFRRNKPTAWARYGKAVADCIAIDYAATIFQTACLAPKPLEVSALFSKIMKIMVEGEILDILFEREGRREEPYIIEKRPKNVSSKKYSEMIFKKTAVLLQACCELAGLCANATPKQTLALQEYGKNLGIAFQMQDDILDIFGDEEKFGKKIGKDIEERKGGNLVLLLALKKLPQKDKNRILAIMKQEKISEPDKKEVVNLIRKADVLIKSMQLARKYVAKAHKALEKLPQNQWNDLLADLATFVVERGK